MFGFDRRRRWTSRTHQVTHNIHVKTSKFGSHLGWVNHPFKSSIHSIYIYRRKTTSFGYVCVSSAFVTFVRKNVYRMYVEDENEHFDKSYKMALVWCGSSVWGAIRVIANRMRRYTKYSLRFSENRPRKTRRTLCIRSLSSIRLLPWWSVRNYFVNHGLCDS